MRRIITLAMAAAMLFSLGSAAAAAGRFGATDLMDVPTSGNLSSSAFGLQGSYDNGVFFLGADLGLLPDLEGGFALWAADSWYDASLRLKYHLLNEKRDGLGLAIGAQDLGRGVFTPYVVAGKTLSSGFQGYLGVGGGALGGIFFGLNKQLDTGRKGASLFLEYDGHGMNLGARLKTTGGLSLDLAVADLERLVIGISTISQF